MIGHFGYRSIFAVLGVMMACDLACVLSINEAAAERQVEGKEASTPQPLRGTLRVTAEPA
jgi:hypothetical protein